MKYFTNASRVLHAAEDEPLGGWRWVPTTEALTILQQLNSAQVTSGDRVYFYLFYCWATLDQSQQAHPISVALSGCYLHAW